MRSGGSRPFRASDSVSAMASSERPFPSAGSFGISGCSIHVDLWSLEHCSEQAVVESAAGSSNCTLAYSESDTLGSGILATVWRIAGTQMPLPSNVVRRNERGIILELYVVDTLVRHCLIIQARFVFMSGTRVVQRRSRSFSLYHLQVAQK